MDDLVEVSSEAEEANRSCENGGLVEDSSEDSDLEIGLTNAQDILQRLGKALEKQGG